MNSEEHQAIIERATAVTRARERGEITSAQFSDECYKMIGAEIAAAKAAEAAAAEAEDESEPAPAPAPAPKPAPRSGNVVQLKTTTQVKPEPKPIVAKRDDAEHIYYGNAVISIIQGQGEDLLITDKAGWHYVDGIWTMKPDRLAYLLDGAIERAIRAHNQQSYTKLVNETRQWIQRQDRLRRNDEDIPWDKHGLIPTESGLVNPRTGECRPFRPDDYATWRIPFKYDPAAECPDWLRMLDDTFADRDDHEKADTIVVIQELLGVGLLDEKPKALSRALIFQGGSNVGKSAMIEVMAALFGKGVNTAAFKSLEGAHGMSAFLTRRPWVLHEAFDQRTWHFSSDVKAIISNEPVQINPKNAPLISMRVTSPIFWGTNHPPQFKESTKAIVNRLVIIRCNREFLPEKPVGVGLKAWRQGLNKPSDLVLRDEMPGVLRWAVQGAKRVLERGHLLLTAAMKAELDQVHIEGNLVAGFLEECVHYDPDKRLAISDLCLAFSQWWLENKGESRSVPTNDSIGKAMTAMGDPRIAIDRELRDNTRRYYGGIVLNEAGLMFHRAGSDNLHLKGKTASTTDPKDLVNQTMTSEWLRKPCIQKMIKKQDERSAGHPGVKF